MKELIFIAIFLIANGLAGNSDYWDAVKTQQRIAHIALVDGGK